MGQDGSRSRKRFTVGCLFAAIGGFCKAFERRGRASCGRTRRTGSPRRPSRRKLPAHPVSSQTGGRPQRQTRPLGACRYSHRRLSVPALFRRGRQAWVQKDERGLLFLHIIRIIKELGRDKPKMLLLENVRNFRTHDRGRTFKRVQNEIQKAGYWFSEKNAAILNTMTHTDIPQNRARVFMVAMSCQHFPSNTFKFPEPLPRGSLRSVWGFLALATSRMRFTTSRKHHSITGRSRRQSKPAVKSQSQPCRREARTSLGVR